MSKALRIGMIGCGGNARGHLRALGAHPEAEVVALVDPSKAMLAAAKRTVGGLEEVPTFDDHRQMLKSVDLDAVALSTPHTLHARQVLDCLHAGLHVLSEKPLTCSLADARKVVAQAKAKRRVVVVAYQRRWHAMRKFMRAFVRDKAFGRPLFVQSFLSQAWLSGTRGKWRQDPALSGGGQLNDSGSHIIDMIFWIMPSRPVEVSAMIENRGARVDIDSAISYRFADGALGSLSILGAGPPGIFWEDMTIAGANGRSLFYRDGALTVVADGTTAEYKRFPRDGDSNAHFIDVVKGRATNESPPQDFLPTIAFTEACWRSARLGGRVVKIKY